MVTPLDMNAPDPKTEYTARLAAARTSREHWEKREALLANLRLVVFVAGVVLAFKVFSAPASQWVWMAAPVAAFVLLAFVHDRVSTQFFVAFLKASERAFQEAPALSVPLLLLQAGEDLIADPAASREFFKKAGSSVKKMKEFKELYHEIFNEPEKKQVFSEMEQWLTDTLQ